ncbi:hypothetical protein DN549_34040, partial [Burkholderia multivorans]
MVRINLGSPGLNPLAQSHLTLGLVLTGSALLVACLDPVRRDVENITITVPLHEIPVQVFLGFGTVSGEVILCLFDARGRVRSVRSREDLSRLRPNAEVCERARAQAAGMLGRANRENAAACVEQE